MNKTKMIKVGKKTYCVTCTDYKTITIYRAWEPYFVEIGAAHFLQKSSHSHVMREGHDQFGNMATRNWPPEIENMTPRSKDRELAETKFRNSTWEEAYGLIEAQFPEATKYEKINGEIVRRLSAPRAEVEPASEEGRGVTVKDPVKDLLEGISLTEAQRLAKLNTVPFRPTDTVGMVKMRLYNCFRNRLRKGEEIIK